MLLISYCPYIRLMLFLLFAFIRSPIYRCAGDKNNKNLVNMPYLIANYKFLL